jgi:hypothetical protein
MVNSRGPLIFLDLLNMKLNFDIKPRFERYQILSSLIFFLTKLYCEPRYYISQIWVKAGMQSVKTSHFALFSFVAVRSRLQWYRKWTRDWKMQISRNNSSICWGRGVIFRGLVNQLPKLGESTPKPLKIPRIPQVLGVDPPNLSAGLGVGSPKILNRKKW